VIGAVLFLACTAVKSVSFRLQDDVSALAPISRSIKLGLYFIYEKTQGISLVWQNAPVIDLSVPISPGNLAALSILIVGLIGRILWDTATLLSRRIKEAEQAVENQRWQQDLLRQQGQLVVPRADVVEISIELDQKDQWYKRPLGMVVLALIGGVVLAWLNLKLGLAKL
jgi:hypothetical protein